VAVELWADIPSNPATTVSSGGTGAPAGGTVETWTVASSTAFPAASSTAAPPTQFHVQDVALSQEVIAVTNVSGTTWTVTRGSEGSTPVAHAAGFGIIQVVSSSGLNQARSTEWLNVQTMFGATGNGVTDDTAAIQAAISAVSTTTGGVVYLPAGQYVTSSPLVVNSSDILLLGSGSLATMGGGGFNDGKLTTIKPSAGWAQGSANAPACILFDASAASINRCGIERISVLGSNVPSGTTMHGIATLGQAGAFSATGCIVGSIANTSSDGITNLVGTLPTAQGNSYVRCLVQGIGGHGFNLASGDMTMEHCHAQGNGLWGIMVTIGAGDTRIANCRADLSTNNGGFYVYVPASAYLGMVQLSNCSTQRNNTNGIQIANTSAGDICPVYLDNCVFQGDGIAGGGNAGIRLSGPVAAVITGGGVHVNTIDVGSGVPLSAITTASDGVSRPVMLNMRGGFYNGVNAFWDQVNLPLTYDIRVHNYTGGQWVYTNTPSVWNSGDNTSANAAVLTPAFTNGAAAQLSDTSRDYMVYLTCTTAGTGLTLAIGPTGTPANALISGATATLGESISVRLPAGWYLEWSATSAAFATQVAIGC
jgi:Pectate lyase superfamily protein